MPHFKRERDNGEKPEKERRQIQQLREGCSETFEQLFRTHYESLCRFTLGYVDHLGQAEDLVQDVFFSLWEARHTLEVERSLKGYLYGMTRNRALKHLRRQRVRDKWAASGELRKAAPRVVLEQADDALQQKELEQSAKEAINELPERRRQIFVLSRRHDLTYAEIAEALDISIKTVETQMSRALKFLHERLATFSAS